MIGYSKIKIIGTKKSRSMDFTDLLSVHDQTTKPNTNTRANPTFKTQESEETNMIKNPETKNINGQDAFIEQEDEDGNNGGESFGVKLHRNSSISSASSLQSAVKRAFSMRRSSSVSERYCRIHDQSVTLTSPFDDEVDTTTETTRSVKKKHGSSKILKACKRLFGL